MEKHINSLPRLPLKNSTRSLRPLRLAIKIMPLILQDTGIRRQVLEMEKMQKSRLYLLQDIKLTKSPHITHIRMGNQLKR